MRTPNDRTGLDFTIECHPAEPDDHGGGFPGIQVDGFLYDEKGLDDFIKKLNEIRGWLKRVSNH